MIEGISPELFFGAVMALGVASVCGIIGCGICYAATESRLQGNSGTVLQVPEPGTPPVEPLVLEPPALRPFEIAEFADWLAGDGMGGQWVPHKRLILLAQEYCWTEGVEPAAPQRGMLMPAGFDRCLADLRHCDNAPAGTKWVLWRVPSQGALADREGHDFGHVQWAAVPDLPDLDAGDARERVAA